MMWELDDNLVAIAGDWHGNVRWVQRAIPALHRVAPNVTTIFHLGDFGIWPERPPGFLGTVDYWCRRSGITRVLVTPGNHDDWDRLEAAFASRPGEAAQLSECVWALPRGYRFRTGGRTVMSFGGAASVDVAERVEGSTWWAAELPTPDDVVSAAAGGPVDILLTHDTPNTTSLLDGPHLDVTAAVRAYMAESSARVNEVWQATRPAVLAHGHLHRASAHRFPDGRRVYCLADDYSTRNLALLTLSDLHWEWVDLTWDGTATLVSDAAM